MAEIRFNYGDKFTQPVNNNIGIGSTIPASKLDIAGATSAGSLRVSGIASLSSYQGFVNTKLSTTEDLIVEAGQSGSVSGEVVVSTGQTISVSTGATTGQGGIDSLKVYQTFMPPVGGIADRPTDVKPGMVYYNKDFKTIEFWDGNFWKQVDNTTRNGRAIIGGGLTPTRLSTISFYSLASGGGAQDFGSLLETTGGCTGTVSDGTRGIFAGGFTPSDLDVIQYITIQSQSDSIDFGNLTDARYAIGSVSSSTRGVFGGGWTPNNTNVIDYVEIQTLGNALDFGDLSEGGNHGNPGCQSPVRGIFGGGYASFTPDTDGPYTGKRLQIINMASKGNATKFGELRQGRARPGGGGNSIRGIWAGGYGVVDNTLSYSGYLDSIEYITISSEGNATDFGNLTEFAGSGVVGTSSQIRFCRNGGFVNAPSSTTSKIIDTVIIATTGNSVNFGELDTGKSRHGGLSDCHGGLGGF